MLIITNKKSECEKVEEIEKYSNAIKNKGVIITIINVETTNRNYENLILSSNKNLIFFAKNFKDIGEILDKMIKSVCLFRIFKIIK